MRNSLDGNLLPRRSVTEVLLRSIPHSADGGHSDHEPIPSLGGKDFSAEAQRRRENFLPALSGGSLTGRRTLNHTASYHCAPSLPDRAPSQRTDFLDFLGVSAPRR